MEKQFSFVEYLKTKKRAHIEIKDPKEYLFNIVSCCLLKEIRYYDTSEERCDVIYNSLNLVAQIDPEFILKLAVYLRHQLYIRTTTNFLLAFCILHENTKPFVQKYFGVSIILPTDLIEVCSYLQFLKYQMTQSCSKQVITDVRKKFKFPRILKICVNEKFPQFSLYQLGKYCSESSRKKLLKSYLQFTDFDKFKKIKDKMKQKKKLKLQKQEDYIKNKNKQLLLSENVKQHKQAKVSSPKSQFDIKFMCMKDILQQCHSKAPQYSIKCILGVKYPQTEEEFTQLFQTEIAKYKLKANTNEEIKFNPNKAGQRMKLDIPKTWETQLSEKGNKREVWEELIVSNSLPYMAMLRNLRNILKVGISDVAHQKVIAKLSDDKQVQSAKIFPLQYFSALVEVDKMIQLTGKKDQNEEKLSKYQQSQPQEDTLILPQDILDSINQFGTFYKEAINKAINLAVEHNLEEIKGLTVVFADVSGSMLSQISGGKRFGSLRTCLDLALLLGLMIRSKCQACDFYLFSSPSYNSNSTKLHQKVKLFPGNDYLKNIQLCREQNKLGGGNTGFPSDCIKKYERKKIKIDNVVILSDLMISVNYNEGMDFGEEMNNKMSVALNGYRNRMNTNLKIFSVDLRGYSQQLNLEDEFNEKNYIRIFGMSDSILRFISLREASQMQEIENYAEVKVADYQKQLKI